MNNCLFLTKKKIGFKFIREILIEIMRNVTHKNIYKYKYICVHVHICILCKKLIVTPEVSSSLYIYVTITKKDKMSMNISSVFSRGIRDQHVTSSAKRSTELRAFQPRP